MLKVEKVAKYLNPKFPAGSFVKHEVHPLVKTAVSGSGMVIISSLLQGCIPVGGAGFMQEPDYLTEAEAREFIDSIFERNNISLTADFLMDIQLDDTTSVTVHLDGYNEELKIGYEYFQTPDDYVEEAREFDDYRIEEFFNKAFENDELYLKMVYGFEDDDREFIDEYIQEFIDSIMAGGNI